MIDIRVDCERTLQRLVIVTNPVDASGIVVFVDSSSELSKVYVSRKDARRLYDALGAHLGITSTESDALTTIAVALEALAFIAVALKPLAPVADALTKLASYATDDPLADSARIP